MKIRNMLRGIPLLLLMVSGLSVFLSCKGPSSNSTPAFYTVTFDAQGGSTVASLTVEHGKTVTQPDNPTKDEFDFDGWYKEKECTTPWNFATDTVTANITLFAKWTPVAPATVTVTFAVKDGHGTLKAKAGDTELSSGASVKKGTEITFTADPAANSEVAYWRINGEVKSGTHKIEKITANKDVTATVTFKRPDEPEPTFFTVDYKTEPAVGGSISAKDADGRAVSSGEKIEENTVLEFTATPNIGYDISGWTGDATAEPDNKTAKLTVTKNSMVTVTFTLKKYEVTFDAQGGTPVPPSQQIEHGKTVQKPADPEKAPFAFGGWYKEKECKTLWNFEKDTVTAATTLYAQWKITIQFDSNKIKCRKNGGGDINPGDTVHENERLNFDAKLTEGYIVDKWTINDTPKDGATGKSFSYVVKASDVKADGSITIGYTDKKATEAKIQFDSPNMTCTKDGGASISSGDTVHENDKLTFTATLPEGEIVDKWLINDKNKGNATYFQYTVKIEDAQNGIIHVKYEKKRIAKAIVDFDSDKMTCTKNFGQATVTKGTTVYEKDLLFFAAKLPKEKIGKWRINGKEAEPQPSKPEYFSYTIKADDNGKTLTIDYTEK